MTTYKVVKEDGVVVDGVELGQDEILELDPEEVEVSELLADGSIIEVQEVNEDEDELPEEDEVEKELSFEGKKITTKVTTSELNGIVYKSFGIEDGTSYKLTEEQFAASVK